MLKVYTLNEASKWDEVVLSMPRHDVYWLSGYVRAFEKHGDGEPLLFYCENGGARGINVVMKRDVARDAHFQGRLPAGTFYDFSTPYGYGGWLSEGEDVSGLLREYEAWTKEQGIVSEFVRFHPMLKNHEGLEDFYAVRQLGEVVHMELESPEAIWQNLSSKNRNMIRKAQKNGVNVLIDDSPEAYRRFQEIYNETMRRDEAEAYYFFGDAFYDSVQKDLTGRAHLFCAQKDGQTIAASIMLKEGPYMNYHLSGSVREFGALAPTNLLLYEAACWGCENGCRTLYLGGGVGSGEDSLFKFKRAFYRGELNHFYIGSRILDQEKYAHLCYLREPAARSYFPAYRA